jgi:hypothetical protein
MHFDQIPVEVVKKMRRRGNVNTDDAAMSKVGLEKPLRRKALRSPGVTSETGPKAAPAAARRAARK